jgi:hypothetical protein
MSNVHHRCHCPVSLAKLGPVAYHCATPPGLLLSSKVLCSSPATWDPGSFVRSQSVLIALDMRVPITGGRQRRIPSIPCLCCPPFCLGPSAFFMCFLFPSLPRWNRTFLFRRALCLFFLLFDNDHQPRLKASTALNALGTRCQRRLRNPISMSELMKEVGALPPTAFSSRARSINCC